MYSTFFKNLSFVKKGHSNRIEILWKYLKEIIFFKKVYLSRNYSQDFLGFFGYYAKLFISHCKNKSLDIEPGKYSPSVASGAWG
jgi:hypothetical protein